jgi:DNA ligase-1
MTDIPSFKTLYGTASSGKTKVWSVEVKTKGKVAVILTTHGYTDGKMTTLEREILVGKNLVKKNETTPLQQAESEARAAWIKKKESGYAVNEEQDGAASATASEDVAPKRGKGIDADVPLPMLAHEYQKRGKGFGFPCYVQPKLDGTRAVGMPGKGIFSRLRKTFPHMEHILGELAQLPEDLVLDGELYTNELTFQEIVGLVKKETLKAGDAEKQLKIKYHVYDLIANHPYETRKGMLAALFASHRFQHLVLVPTSRCESEAQMKLQHNAYVADGFEGIMLRAPSGDYKHSRSADLLKYKEFFDAEYEVVGFKEGEGQEKGCVLWMCRTEEGRTFHCRPRGTRESRMELFQNGAEYVGKMLTVRYQENTDEGLPRFPVGIAFRDYE